jgi:hypothetical protein
MSDPRKSHRGALSSSAGATVSPPMSPRVNNPTHLSSAAMARDLAEVLKSQLRTELEQRIKVLRSRRENASILTLVGILQLQSEVEHLRRQLDSCKRDLEETRALLQRKDSKMALARKQLTLVLHGLTGKSSWQRTNADPR